MTSWMLRLLHMGEHVNYAMMHSNPYRKRTSTSAARDRLLFEEQDATTEEEQNTEVEVRARTLTVHHRHVRPCHFGICIVAQCIAIRAVLHSVLCAVCALVCAWPRLPCLMHSAVSPCLGCRGCTRRRKAAGDSAIRQLCTLSPILPMSTTFAESHLRLRSLPMQQALSLLTHAMPCDHGTCSCPTLSAARGLRRRFV